MWLAITAVVAGCGGGGTSNNSAPPMLASVSLELVSFKSARNGSSNPAVDTIARGGTVTWTWNSNDHDVTSTGSPSFTSSTHGNMPMTHQFTFGNAGTYNYYCTAHGTPTTLMRGTIEVR